MQVIYCSGELYPPGIDGLSRAKTEVCSANTGMRNLKPFGRQYCREGGKCAKREKTFGVAAEAMRER